VGVEPEGAASMRLALDNGSPALLGEVDTIADGLAPVIVGQLTFEHVRDLVDDVVTVDDESIRRATALLIERQKLIVEYSGAATTAALISGQVDVEGRRVAAVVSGGNLDPALLVDLV
ncbi:MAG TPA: pyridoxal-phosphate dependent enzyme, partial [Longimicrobiales bacterium]|nr:pyridoxal-phosphate dependent enzyme [Longimicrobiales bacterium]